jgi:hypothetical protein
MPPPRSWARPSRRCAKPSAATASACRPATPRRSASAPSPPPASAEARRPPRRWDQVFAALNQRQLPARRGPHAEQGMRLRRAEEIETLSYRTVVELNAESRLAPERRVATIARRPERAQRLAEERAGRGRAAPAPARRPRRPQRPTSPRGREAGGGGRCPIDQPCPSRLATRARPGSALIWPPTSTACCSTNRPSCWACCPNQPGWRSCTSCPNAAPPGPSSPRTGRSSRVGHCGSGWPTAGPPAGPVARAAAALAGQGRPGG